MANPTTNYGWPMPTSTDLVTDLPADFAAFGQPVDTSLKALNPETTLGDISYRSSTANTNTRLGIGTTGQVLSVVGGVPAWASASAGLDLITTNTFSAVSSVSLNNIFTSTYTNYKVMLVLNGSADVALFWRLRASSTDNSSSNYGWGLTGIQYTGQAAYNESINGTLDTKFKTGAVGTNYINTVIMDIQNPQQTLNTTYLGQALYPASATDAYYYSISGVASVNTSYDGMTFYPASGTITGTYWIYGYKKA